ncbi:hypothetical protein ACGTN9_10260 [Halobacillus sp. MO56]
MERCHMVFPYSRKELVNHIYLAKTWSAIDFLAMNDKTMKEKQRVTFTSQLTENIKETVKKLG